MEHDRNKHHKEEDDEEETKESYERLAQVGEGTYGKVYKAIQNPEGKLVAMKRIKLELEKEGFPLTAMREIRLLQRVDHPNVLNLQDIICAKGCIYMIFEYMEYDLAGILSHPSHSYDPAHIKCLMKQMLLGLDYLHLRGILHRDIKGSNILINNKGVLKLADFGLAKIYSSKRQDYTNRVITLWYRPPELLLGATEYGAEVDIWGAGCLLLEMYTRKPIFTGSDEISQLKIIYKLLGTPSEATWPDMETLPWFRMLKSPKVYEKRLYSHFSNLVSEEALNLAAQMFEMNPVRRISAAQALKKSYFYTKPLPCDPIDLPRPDSDWHEFESKQRKKRISASAESSQQNSASSDKKKIKN